jgi:hypothetical protein
MSIDPPRDVGVSPGTSITGRLGLITGNATGALMIDKGEVLITPLILLPLY